MSQHFFKVTAAQKADEEGHAGFITSLIFNCLCKGVALAKENLRATSVDGPFVDEKGNDVWLINTQQVKDSQ